MIISKSKKFIFIHIWKTAGTSITKELIPYADLKQRIAEGYWPTKKLISAINYIFSLQDLGNEWLTGFHKHETSSSVIKKIGKEEWVQYYSFAFVRNPFYWLASWFNYINEHPNHTENDRVRAMTFEDFVNYRIDQNCLRQCDFVMHNGELVVDFVGRVENIQYDFNHICDVIGIPRRNLQATNVSRRKQNISDLYNKNLVYKVIEYFEADFEMFDYSKALN